jgi:hypothetical protein
MVPGALPNNNMENKLGRNSLPQLNIPAFEFESEKWSTSRVCNVEEIHKSWKNQPYKVRIFTDRKLAPFSMVMLRKDTFEGVIKAVHDLMNGEAFVRHNFEAVFNSIKLIECLVEKDAEQPDELRLAVKNLTHIWGTIRSSIEFSAPPKKVKPSKLTAEEIAELEKIEDEDKK